MRPDSAPLSTTEHPRESELGRWIYPVLSRRAGGLSLGVNVNPDKFCSFACPYCQVDRHTALSVPPPPVGPLLAEVKAFLTELQPTDLYQGQRLKDISLAGDGEPTLYPQLPELLRGLLQLQQDQRDPFKLVLFTNGSKLHRPDLTDLWPQFHAQKGEVWFKLDFWDQASLQRSNGLTSRPQKILDRLLLFGQKYPVTLQVCVFDGPTNPLDPDFASLWSQQLVALIGQGLKVSLIQLYTLARSPTELSLKPLSKAVLDQLGQQIGLLTQLPIELFYSH